jgi:hypothetical protein
MTRVVATVRKNAREHVRIAWDHYEGHPYLDVRVFYEDGPDLKPTKKVVTVSPRLLGDPIGALHAAQMVGRELSLLQAEEA